MGHEETIKEILEMVQEAKKRGEKYIELACELNFFAKVELIEKGYKIKNDGLITKIYWR